VGRRVLKRRRLAGRGGAYDSTYARWEQDGARAASCLPACKSGTRSYKSRVDCVGEEKGKQAKTGLQRCGWSTLHITKRHRVPGTWFRDGHIPGGDRTGRSVSVQRQALNCLTRAVVTRSALMWWLLHMVGAVQDVGACEADASATHAVQ